MTDQIKQGYIAFITSYLGDADYYATEMFSGLTRRQVDLLTRFVKGCVMPGGHSSYSFYSEDGSRFVMSEVYKQFDKDELLQVMRIAWSEVEFDEESEYVEQNRSDALHDLTYEFFGSGDPNGYGFRVFNSIKVGYVPSPIPLGSDLDGDLC